LVLSCVVAAIAVPQAALARSSSSAAPSSTRAGRYVGRSITLVGHQCTATDGGQYRFSFSVRLNPQVNLDTRTERIVGDIMIKASRDDPPLLASHDSVYHYPKYRSDQSLYKAEQLRDSTNWTAAPAWVRGRFRHEHFVRRNPDGTNVWAADGYLARWFWLGDYGGCS
jgi:hypothetical protein